MFDRFMDLVEENKRRDQERYLERKRRRAQALKWGIAAGAAVLLLTTRAKTTITIDD